MFCMFGRKVEKLGRLPLHNLPPALNLTSANAFEIQHCSFESVCVCVWCIHPYVCVCYIRMQLLNPLLAGLLLFELNPL